MGVNGLWTVVQPCARPTNLATLNRKRLAVDASIWIYQFLKAVRDKEGNALRNSHVVGFFRRICKLLWFGIQPVFVFDGGAPALKRATIQGRKKRREGRREDAVRTASKLLAVQMKRIADEEEEKRKRERGRDRDIASREEAAQHEEIPDAAELVYVDELGMSQKERQQTRRFHKQDPYHLPELQGGIAAMRNPDDPRIMSLEELEEYARQFNSGEDVNLYDFSKIDFDGDFFRTLPPGDRYNILNAGRLRSRLRMGLSKEQLDDMFPDRMAFSKFQIERVKERNNLTQRLMAEAGMTGLDLTLTGPSRIAGEKDREYILVKNDGAEGGWALGVVSKEKDVGEAHKPIDVDAIDIQYQSKDADEEEDDDDFEDVPIEGLNRLPKAGGLNTAHPTVQDSTHASLYAPGIVEHIPDETSNTEGSLFIGGDPALQIETRHTWTKEAGGEEQPDERENEEEEDLRRAIALSLKNQHELDDDDDDDDDDEEFEDVSLPEPEWTQKATEPAMPIRASGGSMIAHIVNNRANAAVSRRAPVVMKQSEPAKTVAQSRQNDADSDSDDDMQTLIAKTKKTRGKQPAPVFENKKNPFDGPLPFPKLDWGLSLFSKDKPNQGTVQPAKQAGTQQVMEDEDEDDEMAGGFEREKAKDEALPLPPWMIDTTDIRENLKKQQEAQRGMDAEDRLEAEEEERQYQKNRQGATVEIESSDDGSDVEIVSKPPSPRVEPKLSNGVVTMEMEIVQDSVDVAAQSSPESEKRESEQQSTPKQIRESQDETKLETDPVPASAEALTTPTVAEEQEPDQRLSPEREPEHEPEPEFEDVVAQPTSGPEPVSQEAELTYEDVMAAEGIPTDTAEAAAQDKDDPFADVEYDEFSDPEDEELMVQMAEEAEEHARFASELNNKSAQQNKEDYEKELRQLRNQQKKDRRDADEVTQVMITECQALLRLFGIPYITAPMEAEAQCAELVSLGLVDGIVTDDSDVFLFGGTRVYKNMFNSNKFVECYLGADIEKELSLSREQLISLAHLLGSDYAEGLPGVGPVTAVEILSEFPGRSGLQQFRDWWQDVQSHSRPKEADASSKFRKKFRKSQFAKLFLPPGFPNPAVRDAYLEPEVDKDSEGFQWGVPDVSGLRNFLMATIGWSKERTDEVLVPVVKDMNKRDIEGTQSNITRFFTGGVGVGAKEAFAPRQKEQGPSKRMAAAVERLRSGGDVGGGAGEGGAGNGKRRKTGRRRANVIEEEEEEEEGGG